MKFISIIPVVLAAVGVASAVPAAFPIGQPIRGKGTVYEQLGVQGSCGELHGEHDAIAAISNEWMNGRYRHEFCGSKIKCTNKGNGKTIVLPVVDTCMGCTKSHVDFSIGAWNRLTDKAPWGIFDLEWEWTD